VKKFVLVLCEQFLELNFVMSDGECCCNAKNQSMYPEKTTPSSVLSSARNKLIFSVGHLDKKNYPLRIIYHRAFKFAKSNRLAGR